jgi:hypothetical protein
MGTLKIEEFQNDILLMHFLTPYFALSKYVLFP